MEQPVKLTVIFTRALLSFKGLNYILTGFVAVWACDSTKAFSARWKYFICIGWNIHPAGSFEDNKPWSTKPAVSSTGARSVATDMNSSIRAICVWCTWLQEAELQTRSFPSLFLCCISFLLLPCLSVPFIVSFIFPCWTPVLLLLPLAHLFLLYIFPFFLSCLHFSLLCFYLFFLFSFSSVSPTPASRPFHSPFTRSFSPSLPSSSFNSLRSSFAFSVFIHTISCWSDLNSVSHLMEICSEVSDINWEVRTQKGRTDTRCCPS